MNEETVNQHHLGKRVAAAFGAKTDFSTGANPASVALADVNGDDNPDIVIANFNTNTASVLLGDGTGSFSTKTDFSTGANPASVALADVNGDGKLDIVTANVGNTASVLLGDGTGSFGPNTDFPTEGGGSFALGDVNRDGKLDIVTVNDGSLGAASVLLGDGTGSLGAKTDFATGDTPQSVALADVNGDGNPDIVTANLGANTASVLLGDGTGSFGAKTDFATGVDPSSVALGDVNRDGKLDIVTANQGYPGTASVLLGDGTGSFGPNTDFPMGASPFFVALGDVNGDGKLDILIANAAGADTVSVLLGTGTGSFDAKIDFVTGTYPYSIALGDVDGNGSPDIVTANFIANTVSVLLNQVIFPSSTPSQSPRISITPSRSISMKQTSSQSRTPMASPNPANKKCQKEGNEFRINTTTQHDQQAADVTRLANGEFVVVWQSLNQDGNSWGVYGQRYNSSGIPLGTEFQVNTQTLNSQQIPSIVGLRDGGFVVVWESLNQDGNGWGIYARRYNAEGQRQGEEFQVNTETLSNQQRPVIAALETGGFVVIWQSLNQDGAGYRIYGRRHDANGQALGKEFRVNSFTAHNQENPSVVALANGGFVVTWQGNGQDGNGWGIYGQRYNTEGKRVGGEFRINRTTASNQERPRLGTLPDGGFVVAWQSYNQDGSHNGIYGRIYNGAGRARSQEFRVNSNTLNDQQSPAVAVLTDGGFIISWQSRNQDGSGWGIYARRYTADGKRSENEFRVTTYIQQDQQEPAIDNLENNRFVVTWESYQQDGNGWGIYGQRFSCGVPNQHLHERDIAIDADDELDLPSSFEIHHQQAAQEHTLTRHQFREIVNNEYNEVEEIYVDEQDNEAGLPNHSSYSMPNIGSSFMLAAVLGKLASSAYEKTKQAAQQLRIRWQEGEESVVFEEASEELKQAFAKLKAQCRGLIESKSLSKWTCFHLEDLLDELEEAVPETLTEADVEIWAEELEIMAEKYVAASIPSNVQHSDNFFKPMPPMQPVIMTEQVALPAVQGRQQLAA